MRNNFYCDRCGGNRIAIHMYWDRPFSLYFNVTSPPVHDSGILHVTLGGNFRQVTHSIEEPQSLKDENVEQPIIYSRLAGNVEYSTVLSNIAHQGQQCAPSHDISVEGNASLYTLKVTRDRNDGDSVR